MHHVWRQKKAYEFLPLFKIPFESRKELNARRIGSDSVAAMKFIIKLKNCLDADLATLGQQLT